MKSSGRGRGRSVGSVMSTARKHLEKRNLKGETLLQRAVIRVDVDAASALLNEGANVNCFDNFGWSALHEACNVGDASMIRLLVQHPNIQVNTCGGYEVSRMKITPLHDAAGNGHTIACQLLVQAGADTSLLDADGLSPLATAMDGGHSETAEFLKSVTFETLLDSLEQPGESPMTSPASMDSTVSDARERSEHVASTDPVTAPVQEDQVRAVQQVLYSLYTDRRTDSVTVADVVAGLDECRVANTLSSEQLNQALAILSEKNTVMVTPSNVIVRI